MTTRARGFDCCTFLAATLAAGGAGVLAATAGNRRAGAAVARAAASTAPAGSDLGAIEHVVFLMQENRSFDHYFGTLPGCPRVRRPPTRDLGAFAQAWPAGTRWTQDGSCPFHLDTARTDRPSAPTTFPTPGRPQHHVLEQRRQMDPFVATHTWPQYEGPRTAC